MARTVLTGMMSHETNTFSIIPADEAEFRRRAWFEANQIPAAYRGTRSSLGATFEAAEKYGWRLVHPIACAANPCGKVTDAVFDKVCGLLLAAAEGVDGVLLHLHGAMVTESNEDGEGELLERLRRRIGPQVPVVVTLDLHANVTDRMCRNVQALVPYRTYPHIDGYERAHQGAALLERAMAGEIRPRMVLARRPLLTGLNHGRTQEGPMLELIQRSEKLEADGDVLCVSVCSGFQLADIHDIGPTVAVAYDEGADPGGRHATRVAEAFMDFAWNTRDYESVHPTPVPEAMAMAKSGEGRPGKPLVIADPADNPGGGGYGDSTVLLGAMIAADLQNAIFHPIVDPAVVREAMAAGVGATITTRLGGKTDPSLGGGPLAVSARVRLLFDGQFIAWGPMGGGTPRDTGPTAVLQIGGITVVVITNNQQTNDLGYFTSVGIDPARASTIGLKSAHHFRAAFEPIARQVIVVDSGALCARDVSKLPFRNVRRPIWPLDQVA